MRPRSVGKYRVSGMGVTLRSLAASGGSDPNDPTAGAGYLVDPIYVGRALRSDQGNRR